jgi:serine/threonine protein kinase
MAFSIGDRIGPYEILAPIGAGGMGEVYRARDTKLDREVAIKVLPAALAQDSERLARFEREARVLASLNHPNIATIYGVEESDGVPALAMEFVHGETLQGLSPVETALHYAKQIAEGLEAAHDKGIIHRDLKPGNIMVTPDGGVKILDFGLAAMDQPSAENRSDPRNSPTMTMAATQVGMIMGTAAYMSPEQASGKLVDKRSDIWSFGVVLYEMLTGAQLFSGETATHTIAEVLRGPIDLDSLPPETPRYVRRLIGRCLDRNPKTRLRDIGEARIALQNSYSEAAAVASVSGPAKPNRLVWGIAGILFLTTAGAGIRLMRQTDAPTAPSVNLSVPLPPSGVVTFLAVSPDGRQLVFTDGGVYLRTLASPEANRIDVGGAFRAPFWSPDSKYIGFLQDNKIKIIPAAGGPVQTLCDGATMPGTGGTWSREGVILFSGFGPGKPIRRVSSSGGDCRDVMKPDGETSYGYPSFLPDGKHFLLFVGGEESRQGIGWASLDDPTPHRLLPDASGPLYVPSVFGGNRGYILFLRDHKLMAQPFDPAGLRLSGDAFAVAPNASYDFNLPHMAVSASDNGVLAYSNTPTWDRRLVVVDSRGQEQAALGGGRDPDGFSPDGRIVLSSSEYQGLFLTDIATNTVSRFANPNMRGGGSIWSGDGSQIAYQSGKSIVSRSLAGGNETILMRNDLLKYPSDWSRDMRYLIYTQVESDGSFGIWRLEDPLGTRKPFRMSAPGVKESEGQLSPDGHWLLYAAIQATGTDVFVRAFPDGPGPWKVSVSRAYNARWHPDGKGVYYISSGKLMSSAIRLDPRSGVAVDTPKPVFDYPGSGAQPYQNIFRYSQTRDGDRFLMNKPSNAVPSLSVLTGWEQVTSARR